MASFVKTKTSVTLVSVGILFLIPLLINNFNAPPSFTRWGEPVTWENFKGVPRIFSRYDAGISSKIFLSYDSSARQYYAYAALNNNYSWAKPAVKDSVHHYLLGHEQYHFNITEIHARLMNKFITENPGRSELEYKQILYGLKRDLSRMQDDYDTQTNHSINRSIQRRWEYRIDSLLQAHAGDSGLVQEYYSGAQAFFPIKPEKGCKINPNEVAFRYSGIVKYDMSLLCISYQDETYNDDPASVEANARNTYSHGQYKIRSFNMTIRSDSTHVFRFIAEDTVNHTRSIDLWAGRDNYLFRLNAKINRPTEDTIGYYQIAESFLNSFKITNTDSYWTSKLDNDTTRITITPMVTLKAPDEYSSEVCYTIPRGKVRGFYRGPIRYDGLWLIAYDIADQPDSLIGEHAIYANNKLITFNDPTADVLYVTQEDDQLKSPFTVAIGYTIKNDTTSSGCSILHNQKIRVE